MNYIDSSNLLGVLRVDAFTSAYNELASFLYPTVNGVEAPLFNENIVAFFNYYFYKITVTSRATYLARINSYTP